MGNAITNPGRFIEKKILHEQFGMPDSHKNAQQNAHADACANQCYPLVDNNYNPADRRRIEKQACDAVAYGHCVKTCIKKN